MSSNYVPFALFSFCPEHVCWFMCFPSAQVFFATCAHTQLFRIELHLTQSYSWHVYISTVRSGKRPLAEFPFGDRWIIFFFFSKSDACLTTYWKMYAKAATVVVTRARHYDRIALERLSVCPVFRISANSNKLSVRENRT